jgi:hypothetical protein
MTVKQLTIQHGATNHVFDPKSDAHKISLLTHIKNDSNGKPVFPVEKLIAMQSRSRIPSSMWKGLQMGTFGRVSSRIVFKRGMIDDSNSDVIPEILQAYGSQNLGKATVKKIIQQGKYITESLKHLVFYLKSKSDASLQPPSQSQLITSGATSIADNEFMVMPNAQAFKVLTVPILTYLEGLTRINAAQSRKDDTEEILTKYVMICLINVNSGRCLDARSVLEFANAIKSN